MSLSGQKCLIYLLDVSSKPQGNHKTKIYNRYTQYKEKVIRLYDCGKSSNQKKHINRR